MEDLFAANPRNLKLPTTGPALLPVCPSSAHNRESAPNLEASVGIECRSHRIRL
jgi:hypothetical protein